ncbi:F0F1 ATP synthase subunit B [Pantoea sp. Nvir]|uniref:F0F1 ATP synthase subunit B n=1 Tax=Pantoea sp. Nvir TaxID=2576760 RepID=UPI001358B087|nr:F0F1 ATP synthase subunit B [Pantoea sp. Nvir]MXP67069.1 F0F1 ATP synthase subunit B [Pantoea sp. Nvir]CAJ0990730.1 ATP synthase subunit b [Pantoea sp. Nvir]
MNINATIFGQAIAFLLFVTFCMRYVWPPIIGAIEKRQKEVAEGLASAERAKKELDFAQAQATDQMKKVKEEAQIIIEQAHKRRTQILDEAKTEAQKERNRIIAQAQEEIDAERRRAQEELRKQVALLAIAGAEKIIEHSIIIDEATNSDIINKIVAELSRGGANV